MGNRATIHLKSDTQDRGVYVQWNGGAGSVAAFLEETRRRMSKDRKEVLTLPKGDENEVSRENETLFFYSTLHGVIRDYFNYASPYKERESADNSLVLVSNISTWSGEDNGQYDVENDFSCKRINTDQLTDYEAENATDIKLFFELQHQASCTVVQEQELHYKYKYSADELKEQLEMTRSIAKNAQHRAEWLQMAISNLEAKDEEVCN